MIDYKLLCNKLIKALVEVEGVDSTYLTDNVLGFTDEELEFLEEVDNEIY